MQATSVFEYFLSFILSIAIQFKYNGEGSDSLCVFGLVPYQKIWSVYIGQVFFIGFYLFMAYNLISILGQRNEPNREDKQRNIRVIFN